jgi:hypothetical protein
MSADTRDDLIETLPTEAEIEDRLCRALREADLCRRLLRVARRADQFRQSDRRGLDREEGPPCRD